jgi:hypothetical protein
MKIVTASNGKKTLKMSKKEWENIGKKAGWKVAQNYDPSEYWMSFDTDYGRLGSWELASFRPWYKKTYGIDPYQTKSSATDPEEAQAEHDRDYKNVSYFLRKIWPKIKESIKPESYMSI